MKRSELPIMDLAFKADPVPFYEGVRRKCGPVAPVRLPSGTDAWLITGYREARCLLNDGRLSKHRSGHSDKTPLFGNPIFNHLLMLDPPRHTHLRAIVNPHFTTKRVGRLAGDITSIAARLLDDISSAGTFDVIGSFATLLPLKVIFTMLDLPPDQDVKMQNWLEQLNDADLYHPENTPEIANAILNGIVVIVNGLRSDEKDSLIGQLHREHKIGVLSLDELCAMIFLLMGAGYETTSSLIGNGIHAMLRNRSEWIKLCRDENLAKSAVEEVLRFECPLEVSTPRYALSSINIGGTIIPQGDLVFIALAAANRDPNWLADGHLFRIDRKPIPAHLSFGQGIHFCLGAPLARLEGDIVFRMLASRFPDMDICVPEHQLRWKPGLIMRRLEALPVNFSAAK